MFATPKQKIRLLFETIEDLKTKNQNTISKLHKEIHNLTLKCSDLSFELAMYSGGENDGNVEIINKIPTKKRKRPSETTGGDKEEKDEKLKDLVAVYELENLRLKKGLENKIERQRYLGEKIEEVTLKNRDLSEKLKDYYILPKKIKKLQEELKELKNQSLSKESYEEIKKDVVEKYVNNEKSQKMEQATLNEIKKLKSLNENLKKEISLKEKDMDEFQKKVINNEKSSIKEQEKNEEFKDNTRQLVEKLEIENKLLKNQLQKNSLNFEKRISLLRKNQTTKVNSNKGNSKKQQNRHVGETIEDNRDFIEELSDKLLKKENELKSLQVKNESLQVQLNNHEILKDNISHSNQQNLGIKKDLRNTRLVIKEKNKRIKELEQELENSPKSSPRKSKKRKYSENLVTPEKRKEKKVKREKREKHSPRRPSCIIAFSGFGPNSGKFSRDLKHKLKNSILELNGVVLDDKQADIGGITHLIVSPKIKTMKKILALVEKKWILSPEWIIDSHKKKTLVKEDDYGFKTKGSLYDGKKFYLTKKFREKKRGRVSIEKASTKLIQVGGGSITFEKNEADFLLLCENELPDFKDIENTMTWPGFIDWICSYEK